MRPSHAPGPAAAGSPAGDDGAAAVLVLALAGLLVLLASVAVAVGAAGVARHRVAAAADLAALAAAGRAVDGTAAACSRAERVATAQRARLTSCRLVGDVADVTAQVRPPGPLGELGIATARARAGPADTAAAVATGLPGLVARSQPQLQPQLRY